LTGEPHTQHTTYTVPCMAMDVDNWKLSCQCVLSGVAPTVVELRGIPRPECMTSTSILLRSRKRVARSQQEVKLKGVA